MTTTTPRSPLTAPLSLLTFFLSGSCLTAGASSSSLESMMIVPVAARFLCFSCEGPATEAASASAKGEASEPTWGAEVGEDEPGMIEESSRRAGNHR